MICPFWQKPHCGTCSSIQACCTGWSFPFLAMPSSVVTSFLTLETGVMHDRVATPLMMTVHAPHWPSPQPNRGPRKAISLRRIYSSGVVGSMSKVCVLPFTFSVMLLILRSPSSEARHYAGLAHHYNRPYSISQNRNPAYGEGVALAECLRDRPT